MRRNAPWLIMGKPIPNSVAKPLEADLGVVGEILHNFLLIEPAAISLPEGERKVPAVVSRAQTVRTGTR
jgi:hypothetical protein